MTWRYQPVWQEDGLGRRSVFLIEVYFDEDGGLKHWTTERGDPVAETAAGLARDLTLMLRDALRWEPVEFGELRVGMVFAERTD